MKWLHVTVLALLFCAPGLAQQPKVPVRVAEEEWLPLWNRNAAGAAWEPKAFKLPSPDGTKWIQYEPGPFDPERGPQDKMTVHAFGRDFPTLIGHRLNAEVQWSPDSSAILLTYSEGGGMGPYRTQVLFVRRNGLHALEPVRDGLKLIREWCYYGPEAPEIGGVGWPGNDASRVLISVSVPGHSSCACMGQFSLFEIALPSGRVLRKWNQVEAQKHFGEKLSEPLLKREGNECLSTPDSCIPNGFDLSKKPKWYGKLPQER